MYKDTFVIIPVYNEGSVIREVIDEVSCTFDNIVCVDDGSTDNSALEIKKTKAHYLYHFFNMGQGASLQTGIDFAIKKGAKFFVTFDADGQHRVEDAVKMRKLIEQEELDIVLGTRFGNNDLKIPLSKRIILKLGINFTNKLTGLTLTDAHNGLRVFNRNFASEVDIQESGMGHASEIVSKIYGFKFKECPVKINYTDYSKKKGQSIINAVNIGIDELLNSIRR